MSKINFIVGIDPGASTGVGIIRKADDKIMWWGTKDFHTLPEFLENTFPNPPEVKLVVEIPAAFLYGRHATAGLDPHDQSDGGAELKIRDRKMLNIGGVRREAQLLAEVLRRKGWLVLEVPPVRSKKWDQKEFQRFSKSQRRATEHERDACRLALHHAHTKA